MTVALTREEWLAAQAQHEERARAVVDPHLARRSAGKIHPVWDFLFDYYRFRPTHLTRWHPGLGTELLDAARSPASPVAGMRHYTVDERGTARLDTESFLAKRGAAMEDLRVLLTSIGNARPHFGCFGLHEWAMVYKTDAPRHGLPLRLGERGTNEVVDTHPIRCTHFDAYRFFTPAARSLNAGVLSRDTQADNDQPGCVHVTMDLYKWAAKMGPVVPGNLLLDCFDLAARARRLDMEASPYDCTALGFGVVAVETPEGKAEYVRRQRELQRDAAPLRARLVALVEALLTVKMTRR